MIKKHFSNIVSVLVAIGFLDTLYLSYKKFIGSELVCNLLNGCDVVTSSPYASMFGIPLAYWGLALYTMVLVIMSMKFGGDEARRQKIYRVVFSVAFAFSLYFLYLQVFVIQALCEYCLVSLCVNALLFVMVWWWYAADVSDSKMQ